MRIQIVTFLLISEPDTENGESKLQASRGKGNFLWFCTSSLVVPPQTFILGASSRFPLQSKVSDPLKIFPGFKSQKILGLTS